MESAKIDQFLGILSVPKNDGSENSKVLTSKKIQSEFGKDVSREQLFFEYLGFLRNLPVLIKPERERLIKLVTSAWHIDEITNSISELDFNKLSKIKCENQMLNQLSIEVKQSLKVIGPPTTKCLLCGERLTLNNPPTQIAVHGMNGPEIYSKYILRCRQCHLDKKHRVDNKKDKKLRQDIYYHPDKFGNRRTGWLFYDQSPDYVRASNEVYLEKRLVESSLANFLHGFMSVESQAEAFNETFRESEKVAQFKRFLEKNPKVGKHFEKRINAQCSDDEMSVPMNENYNEKEVVDTGDCVFSGMFELHRKSLSQAYYNYWVRLELEERGLIGKYFFGPYFYETEGSRKIFNYKDSVDCFLEEVENWRKEELYQHDKCTGLFLFLKNLTKL